jgi:hypothetical protein
MSVHRKITGRTADGVPIEEPTGRPSRDPRTVSIPKETSTLGGQTRKLTHGPLDLNPRRPSFERIEGEEK